MKRYVKLAGTGFLVAFVGYHLVSTGGLLLSLFGVIH
ncbi:MAG: hypothetical protein JWN01_446 [Patescibacteria group bacterium]|nr:hypothetical protein [Patescibacteria group bacterium]